MKDLSKKKTNVKPKWESSDDSQTPSYLNISTINARSIRANDKLSNIKEWHLTNKHTATIITESWLDYNYNDPTLTQTPPATHRGVATLITPTTVSNIQPIFKELWTPCLSAIVIHIKNRIPIIIIGFYSQPPN